MTANTLDPEIELRALEIKCGQCLGKLPLRMSQRGERGVVWLCAECSVPFVSLCVTDRLQGDAERIRLDERYFDTEGLPAISPKVRREVAKLAERAAAAIENNHRRSERISQSLVVPAIKLNEGLNPEGYSFQVMVANVSREGIGLVHNESIDSEFIALKLTLDDQEPIQVVVRLVRERELQPPLREIGGEFFVRLGSIANESKPTAQSS